MLIDEDELLRKYIGVSLITTPLSAQTVSYPRCLGQSDDRVRGSTHAGRHVPTARPFDASSPK